MKKVLQALIDMQTKLPVQVIILVLVISLLLGLVIYFTYKNTFTGVLYNQRFNVSLVMLTVLTTMVMAVIGSNISVSLGMVGALSIVRFRTAIKDPRDTAFIFWCIVVGLAVGTQNYYIATIGSIFVSVILFIFKKVICQDNKYVLVIKGQDLNIEELEELIKNSTTDYSLKSKYTNSSDIELVYDVKFNPKSKERDIKGLDKYKNIESINIVQVGNETMG